MEGWILEEERVCCGGVRTCVQTVVCVSLRVTMPKEEEAPAEGTNAVVVEKPDAAVAVLAFEEDDDDDELYGDLGNFSGITDQRLPPLSSWCGYRLVRIAALDGEQDGAAQNALLKKAPSEARRSNVGVWMTGSPYTPA